MKKISVRTADTTLEWAERKRAFDRWRLAALGGGDRQRRRRVRLVIRKMYTR